MNTPVPPDRGARAPRPTEHNLDKHARDAIGGALRPGDPRRFVVEAMLGAVQADGVVDPRELAVLDRHLGEHELFQGVRAEMARTMIDLAADALRFAGSSTARIGAIARGLPSRIHRGAAYAMACEVVAADDDVSPAELTFLEHLRLALRVSPEEALGVQAALRGRRLGRHLDEQVAHVRSLAPLALELAGLRAVVEGVPPPARELILAMPDLAGAPDEIDAALARGGEQPREQLELGAALSRLARAVPAAIDRWWLVVYAIALEPVPWGWRSSHFLLMAQYAFGLADADLDFAASDALVVAPAARAS